jgi:hypothetical protein
MEGNLSKEALLDVRLGTSGQRSSCTHSIGMKSDSSDECAIPIPRDILQESVLSFVDLYSLVRFSGCSRLCQALVFRDSPSNRWKEIQFCNGVTPCGINDNQLASFLTRSNAKENTQVLSLTGCPNIRGSGLEPLRQSRVLEDIDLRVIGTVPLNGEDGMEYGPTGLDEEYVVNVLTSMIQEMELNHYNHRSYVFLGRVAFRSQQLPVNRSNLIASMMASLNSTRERCWRLQSPQPCLKCKRTSPQDYRVYPSCIAPLCNQKQWCTSCKSDSNPRVHCVTCESNYCGNCSPQLIICSVCNHNYCKPCAMPPACSACDKMKCQWCSNLTTCQGCKKECCASHGFESCGKCDKIFCLECCDDELLFCVVCNRHYCGAECHKGVHG